MKLFIQPVDVLFFRDSKPFGAGESHAAKGAYMPGPQPFAGAVRTAVLAQELALRQKPFSTYAKDKAFQAEVKEIGTPQQYGEFALTGPFAAQMEEGMLNIFLPTPLDLLKEREDDSAALRGVLPVTEVFEGISTNLRTKSVLWIRQEQAPSELDIHAFKDEAVMAYLQNDDGRPPIQIADEMKAEADFMIGEDRTGIALSEHKTAKEGHLYTNQYLRLTERPGIVRGFFVETNVTSLPPIGLLKLGGEGRMARYQVVEDKAMGSWLVGNKGKKRQELKNKVGKSNLCKIYLASPAVFAQGWLPDFIDKDTLLSKEDSIFGRHHITLQLISAAIGKPVSIGGWDLAKKYPKTMYKAVPGGSVYFFKCIAGNMEDIFDLLHGTTQLQQCSESSELQELACIGYGLTFVGVWQPVMEVE